MWSGRSYGKNRKIYEYTPSPKLYALVLAQPRVLTNRPFSIGRICSREVSTRVLSVARLTCMEIYETRKLVGRHVKHSKEMNKRAVRAPKINFNLNISILKPG